MRRSLMSREGKPMQKTELRKERAQRHGQALDIVARRKRECSSQSADAKTKGDLDLMYRLNTAWHWLDSIERDLMALDKRDARS